MNAKNVVIIAVLAALTAGAAWWFNAEKNGSSQPRKVALFPALSGQVDKISQIHMKNAKGDKATLVNTNNTWRVTERSGYFADTSKVKALLYAINEAKVIELKTANPEFYQRLGVREITEPDSEAVLMEIEHNGTTHSMLIGSDSSRGNGASHARQPDATQAVLVSPQISLDTDPMHWLDKTVLNIAATDVQSVAITRAGGDSLTIAKSVMFDEKFVLQNAAQDKVVDDAGVDQLAAGLAALSFERVIKTAAFAARDYQSFDVTYTLFDGVVIDGKVFYPREKADENDDAQNWFGASARFDEAVANKFVPQPDSADADTVIALTAADLAHRRSKAAKMNARLKGWLFQIPDSRFTSLDFKSD